MIPIRSIERETEELTLTRRRECLVLKDHAGAGVPRNGGVAQRLSRMRNHAAPAGILVVIDPITGIRIG
jgi:hypothetical protein